jgi:hypothetical protein
VFQQLAIAQDERRRWGLVLREVDAREFVRRTKNLPVEISDHVVDRLLQRLGAGGVRDALERLQPAMPLILALMAVRTQPFLAPVAGGGAVIVAPSDRADGNWCLATYVGERQLRLDQRRELELNRHQAARIGQASAPRAPVTERLAAAIRDALHDAPDAVMPPGVAASAGSRGRGVGYPRAVRPAWRVGETA